MSLMLAFASKIEGLIYDDSSKVMQGHCNGFCHYTAFCTGTKHHPDAPFNFLLIHTSRNFWVTKRFPGLQEPAALLAD